MWQTFSINMCQTSNYFLFKSHSTDFVSCAVIFAFHFFCRCHQYTFDLFCPVAFIRTLSLICCHCVFLLPVWCASMWWSKSAEVDPAYQTCSSGGFHHHMADPVPAASPGVACAWIRVTSLGICLLTIPIHPAWPHRCRLPLFNLGALKIFKCKITITKQLHFSK